MKNDKCDHLVGILRRYGYSKNITEEGLLKFHYSMGAIVEKFDILSKIDKGVKKNKEYYIVDALGIEGLTRCNGKNCLVVQIERFGYCPFCGEKLDWEALDKKLSEKYRLARTKVDKDTVIKRFLKRKLEEEQKQLKLELARSNKRDNVGYVYLVKLDKHYKIGISKSPNARLKEFTLLPYELETVIVEKVKGYDKREKELHEHFAEKRVRGEWFELDENDIAYIKSYLKGYEVK